jgi:hypothetical protein
MQKSVRIGRLKTGSGLSSLTNRVFILECGEDRLTGSGGHQMKNFTPTVSIIQSGRRMESCFRDHLDGGKWDLDYFDVPKGEHINLKMYCDQILAGPLNDFWTESFSRGEGAFGNGGQCTGS